MTRSHPTDARPYAYCDPWYDRPTLSRGGDGMQRHVRPGWSMPQLAALFGGPTPPEKGLRRSFDP